MAAIAPWIVKSIIAQTTGWLKSFLVFYAGKGKPWEKKMGTAQQNREKYCIIKGRLLGRQFLWKLEGLGCTHFLPCYPV
mgnify:CR=1 FL=1